MSDNFKEWNDKFAVITKAYTDEDAACEIEGHDDETGIMSSVHDDEGAQWWLLFMCPDCGDTLSILSCDTFRNAMVSWIEAGIKSVNPFFICDCGRDSDLYEAYVRSVKWG